MQFPKELRHEVLVPLAAHAGASMKYSSRRNCDQAACHTATCSSRLNEVQFPKELRRSESGAGSPTPCGLNEVQFPKELRRLVRRRPRVPALASMKCSSRRNCDGPLSIARHHAHLRRLRERSALGLPLSHPTPHLTSQIPRHFNVLPLRALPGDPRAPERSHQAISGPSGVIVLVRPT